MSASAWASWATDELFRHNFDRRHGRITRHWHELQKKLALRVGLKPSNFFHQRMILSGFFEKVQIGRIVLPLQNTLNMRSSGFPDSVLRSGLSAPALRSMKCSVTVYLPGATGIA